MSIYNKKSQSEAMNLHLEFYTFTINDIFIHLSITKRQTQEIIFIFN